jgi:hypothetical protein
MTTILFATAASSSAAGLLGGLIHLLIILFVIAIVYYIGLRVITAFGAEAPIPALWLGICALIALYFVVVFLLAMV